MGMGAPVPFGLISPQKKPNLAIVLAGVQQYSSDSTHTLCKEYISEKQAKLDDKLDMEIERLSGDPVLRRKYREQKERESKSYLQVVKTTRLHKIGTRPERIIFDNRTQMNADNQDFKLNFGTKPEVKREAFDNLREQFSA